MEETKIDSLDDVSDEMDDIPVDKDKYPPSIKYIMWSEACERY